MFFSSTSEHFLPQFVLVYQSPVRIEELVEFSACDRCPSLREMHIQLVRTLWRVLQSLERCGWPEK